VAAFKFKLFSATLLALILAYALFPGTERFAEEYVGKI
jgi:hypothetical protein